MSAPANRTSSRLRVVKRAGLVLASLVVGAVAVEFGYRAWQHARGKDFDAVKARSAIERCANQATDLVPRVRENQAAATDVARAMAPILHPFYGYDQVGGVDQLSTVLTNARASDDELEIFIVGGSVSTIFFSLGAPRLAAAIEADPRFDGKRVRFSCYGRGGHKQPQQLGMINWLFGLGLQPALVLNIDGFNEVAISNDNVRAGVHPVYPSAGHWASLASGGVADRSTLDHALQARRHQDAVVARATRALAWGYDKSYLLTQFTLRALNRDLAAARTAFGEYQTRLRELSEGLVLHGPTFDARPEVAVHDAVRMWAESSRSLRALCAERGIAYVHVLQPNVLDVGDRTLTPAEIEADARGDSWPQGVHLGYPLLRVEGARLAAHGVRFVDATRIFDGEGDVSKLYDDRCHFGQRGNDLLGDFIARAVAEALAAR